MQHSKRAIWLACLDEKDGERLLEIARDHVRLVNELPKEWGGSKFNQPDPFETTRDIYETRIQQLRDERDSIIKKYEEANSIEYHE